MLEELRVSIFAPSLGTNRPVSTKRIHAELAVFAADPLVRPLPTLRTGVQAGQCALVPLVDVTYEEGIDEEQLRRLPRPPVRGRADGCECPEEPATGPPALGDLEIRFHCKGTFDCGELRVVVEIRAKRFESRVQTHRLGRTWFGRACRRSPWVRSACG